MTPVRITVSSTVSITDSDQVRMTDSDPLPPIFVLRARATRRPGPKAAGVRRRAHAQTHKHAVSEWVCVRACCKRACYECVCVCVCVCVRAVGAHVARARVCDRLSFLVYSRSDSFHLRSGTGAEPGSGWGAHFTGRPAT